MGSEPDPAGQDADTDGGNQQGELLKSLLEDMEPLEELDDAEYGLPPIENPPSLEDILAGHDDGCDDEVEDDEDRLSLSSNEQPLLAGQQPPEANWNLEETLSVKSRGSENSKTFRKPRRLLQHPKGSGGGLGSKICHGSTTIMRHVVLNGISAQMTSARERANAGLPTVMAATFQHIAVGTSHGLVLVFDNSQTLRCSLGMEGGEGGPVGGAARDQGSVSSMAFCPTEPSRLLAGYAKGQVVEYDVSTGKMLRRLDESSHPLGSAITHIRFMEDPLLALICDSGGSVFDLSFRWTLAGVRAGGFDSRCIFSGSRGEVCTLEPLSLAAAAAAASDSVGYNHQQYGMIGSEAPGSILPGHRGRHKGIVALATISKVIVLTVRPTIKVLFTHPLPGRKDTLPLLAWQFVIIQMSKSNKVMDPVLAFGRQNTIHFFQLSENLSNRLVFVPLQTVDLPYELLNFGWLNTRCLAILDSKEVFHLYDVKTKETLEDVDLSGVQLCYGSSFFKGLATGGNVSAAMTAAGDKATYGSFQTFTNQLLLLGSKTFNVLVVRTWIERLEFLIKRDRHLEALGLGLAFYQDQKGKALLVGLKGPKEKRKAVISRKLRDLLIQYVNHEVMGRQFPAEGNMTLLQDYFDKTVYPCVEVCLAIGAKDLLFGPVWDTFSADPFAKASFLESLEPHLLNNRIRDLPVQICQDFVAHFDSCGRFTALEACLTHLEVSSIDLHQAMNICWARQLYDALIYIYNNGMMDFISPAEELLTLLAEAQASDRCSEGQSPREDVIRLGNKLLVYISGCLAGRAYPYGDIRADMVAKVKYDVYTCLTALRAKRGPTEGHHPHLRTLLRFDTQGLLNVISIAFEEPEFNTELGICQKQRLIDILLQLMVGQGPCSESDAGSDGSDFSPCQVAHLFTFLARQMAKDNSGLQVPRDLFERVLDILTDAAASVAGASGPNSPSVPVRMSNQSQNGSNSTNKEEWQQALLDLLNAGGIKYFEMRRLGEQARRVGFHRVLELLYERDGDFENLLPCYLNDPLRANQHAFTFLQKVLSTEDHHRHHHHDDGSSSQARREAVQRSVLTHLGKLVSLDAQRTASLVHFHMASLAPVVAEKLEADPTLRRGLYEFTKETLELREASGTSGEGQTRGGPKAKPQVDALSSSFSGTFCDDVEEEKTYEKFIGLMCEFEPKMVAPYLRAKAGSYRVSAAIRICQSLLVHGDGGGEAAVAYLLEQDGRIEEAFQVVKKGLDSKIAALAPLSLLKEDDIKCTDKGSANPHELGLLWVQINASVILLVQLCQRMGGDVTTRESLWFQVLDSILGSKNGSSQSDPSLGLIQGQGKQALKELVKHVINSALVGGQAMVSLRRLVERVIGDPMYQGDRFGDVREFLVGMLQAYLHEETMVRSSTDAFWYETHCELRNLKSSLQRGLGLMGGDWIAETTFECDLCQKHLALMGGQCILFQCNHKFHLSCLARAGCLVLGLDINPADHAFKAPSKGFVLGEISPEDMDSDRWHCYHCMSSSIPLASGQLPSDPSSLWADNSSEMGLEVEAITNQRVIKGRQFLAKLKEKRISFSLKEPEGDILGASGSIFVDPAFPLDLCPRGVSD